MVGSVGNAPSSWMVIESNLGTFAVGGDDEAVTDLLLPHEVHDGLRGAPASVIVRDAARQLDEYLSGERRRFEVSIRPRGTEFQQAVWSSLDGIDFGSTRSYAWVADVIGRPRGARAVGQALGRNPTPIIRPCHRVLSSSGLGGYGGGSALKRSLLAIEGVSIEDAATSYGPHRERA